ncbi:EAL domain-containing protein [Oceanimonas pelagia]|uniref:EAL domain-containing protein n=1 Tax=Oceanimonas pelagia TaxID=3028314 RepID=A0AA50Q960_9GAMM|nr:EAL domain-containing protein [Oceanimonas pelagia]WMC09623.1 EAL domain-containing protein [Oceanimonas pelagia]
MDQHNWLPRGDAPVPGSTSAPRRAPPAGSLTLARQVMQYTREGIVIMDARGRVLEVNPAFCHHCELAATELEGRHITQVSKGLHEGRYYRRIWQRLQLQQQWEGEVEHITRRGEVVTHWLMLRLIHDEAGRITHIVGILDNISRLRQSEERLSFLAHHDSLTGTANREFLLSWFSRIRADLAANEQLALLFIDLDRFKPINDGFGHGVGDRVLQALAERLQQMVDANEMVARIGGDEFVMVWRDIDTEQTLFERAARLLERLEAPVRVDQHELSVGASVGISLYPKHGLEIETLLRYADTAMYEAKTYSRSHIALFDSDSFAQLEQRGRLAGDFRAALAQGQLFLEYQPRMDLASGTLPAVEALLRWHHPTLGLVAPDAFLPAARDAGLLGRLAEWVFTEAAQQQRRWHELGWRGRISLNMSGLEPELEQPRILRLIELLRARGVNPADFELELRSDFIMRRSESLLRVIEGFRAAGMAVYLDNLGHGRFRFDILKGLPVDGIKLDRGLLTEPLDAFDRSVIQALLLLAHTLGLNTVACGVESAGQLAFLREHGCRQVQGEWLAGPLASERVPGFIPALPGSAVPG